MSHCDTNLSQYAHISTKWKFVPNPKMGRFGEDNRIKCRNENINRGEKSHLELLSIYIELSINTSFIGHHKLDAICRVFVENGHSAECLHLTDCVR